ncbi:unnamed protein product [Urochloa humidicola]
MASSLCDPTRRPPCSGELPAPSTLHDASWRRAARRPQWRTLPLPSRGAVKALQRWCPCILRVSRRRFDLQSMPEDAFLSVLRIQCFFLARAEDA